MFVASPVFRAVERARGSDRTAPRDSGGRVTFRSVHVTRGERVGGVLRDRAVVRERSPTRPSRAPPRAEGADVGSFLLKVSQVVGAGVRGVLCPRPLWFCEPRVILLVPRLSFIICAMK